MSVPIINPNFIVFSQIEGLDSPVRVVRNIDFSTGRRKDPIGSVLSSSKGVSLVLGLTSKGSDLVGNLFPKVMSAARISKEAGRACKWASIPEIYRQGNDAAKAVGKRVDWLGVAKKNCDLVCGLSTVASLFIINREPLFLLFYAAEYCKSISTVLEVKATYTEARKWIDLSSQAGVNGFSPEVKSYIDTQCQVTACKVLKVGLNIFSFLFAVIATTLVLPKTLLMVGLVVAVASVILNIVIEVTKAGAEYVEYTGPAIVQKRV